MKYECEPFNTRPDHPEHQLIIISNQQGLSVKLTDYGATLVSLDMPGHDGKVTDVVVGPKQLDGFLLRHPYFGSTVGRCCNRISGARFQLDGQLYSLAANAESNHLHGGIDGFDRATWEPHITTYEDRIEVAFTYTSPHMEEGYPGQLEVTTTYTLSESNRLSIAFHAVTDRATVVNLTNHAYWNLAGCGTIADHHLLLKADQVLAVDEGTVPTGEFTKIDLQPLDFRMGARLGDQLARQKGLGFDHCYVLGLPTESPRFSARLWHPPSHRALTIETTMPGIQLYTGNYLDGSEKCAGYRRHSGLCLETQFYPNAPNIPTFPSIVLRPGQVYRQITHHDFHLWDH